MPTELEGLVAIKTAHADRRDTSPTFLTFTLAQAATLYVAYDAQATRFPDWLTTAYTDTEQTIHTTNTPLRVWQREVTAGPIALPGNLYGDPAGVRVNYIVLLDFQAQGAAQTWVWNQAALDTTPVFFLEAGNHTLKIKQRESGAKLDRLLMTNDLESIPQE
jgi:hypothetical protein